MLSSTFRTFVACCALAALLPACHGPAIDPQPTAVAPQASMRAPGWLNIVSDSIDPNGFLINPHWAVQDRREIKPIAFPVVDAECKHFARWRSTGPNFLDGCTTQLGAVTFARAPLYMPWFICPLHYTYPNHINWRVGNEKANRAATVGVGRIYFGDISIDGDLDLFLRTPGDPGRTWGDRRVTNATDSMEGRRLTEVEFHLDEVQRNLDIDDWWWGKLAYTLADPSAIREGRRPAEVLNGLSAVVTGIFGVDGVHDAHSEIHPVFAMAVRIAAAEDTDRWAVFARNWGDEGMCSSRDEILDLPDNTITVWIPWRPGATGARVHWRGSVAAATTDSPVTVRIPLKRPHRHSVAEGVLEITWQGPVIRDTLRADSALKWKEVESPEELANREFRALSRPQREAVLDEVAIYRRTETARAKSAGGGRVSETDLARIGAGADSVRIAGICRHSAHLREIGGCTFVDPPRQ